MTRQDGYPPIAPPPGAGNVFDWILRAAAERRAKQRADRVIGAASRPNGWATTGQTGGNPGVQKAAHAMRDKGR